VYTAPLKRRMIWRHRERHLTWWHVAAGLFLLVGWQLLPTLQMQSLGPVIGELKQCRDVHGHFPAKADDLPLAMQRRLYTIWGSRIRYEGGDRGFALHFDFEAYLWELGETSRFEYDTGSDDWFHWYD